MPVKTLQVYCAYDDLVNVTELKPNPQNPNAHPDLQIEKLAAIIDGQGWRHPITVSRLSGFIVAGHARLAAAIHLGVDSVPVDYQDFKSEAEELAVLVADNIIQEFNETDHEKLAGVLTQLEEADYDLELTALEPSDLDDYIRGQNGRPGLTPDDEIPAPPPVTKTKPGDIWLLGDHRLMCGDALKKASVKKLIGRKRAVMVFTDPPYNVNYKGGVKQEKSGRTRSIKNDAFTDSKLFYDFLVRAINNLKPYVVGDVYICMSSSMLHILFNAFYSAGGHWSTFIIWVKDSFTIGWSNYQRQYEPILYGWFEGSSHYWSGKRNLGDVVKSDDIVYDPEGHPMVRVMPGGVETDIWEFPKPKKSPEHPTMKPTGLCMRGIRNSSAPGGLVLDLFLGSGSTLIACEKLDRVCFGMEIDPVFCDVAVKRWEDFTGRKAKKWKSKPKK
jgi:DNA modification methylase